MHFLAQTNFKNNVQKNGQDILTNYFQMLILGKVLKIFVKFQNTLKGNCQGYLFQLTILLKHLFLQRNFQKNVRLMSTLVIVFFIIADLVCGAVSHADFPSVVHFLLCWGVFCHELNLENFWKGFFKMFLQYQRKLDTRSKMSRWIQILPLTSVKKLTVFEIIRL